MKLKIAAVVLTIATLFTPSANALISQGTPLFSWIIPTTNPPINEIRVYCNPSTTSIHTATPPTAFWQTVAGFFNPSQTYSCYLKAFTSVGYLSQSNTVTFTMPAVGPFTLLISEAKRVIKQIWEKAV